MSKNATPTRGPIAIDLAPKGKEAKRAPLIVEQGDFTEVALVEVTAAPQARSRRLPWLGTLFWGALGLLASLYLMDAAWDLVLRLGMKNPILGQVGLGLIGIALLALVIFIAIEWLAMLRLAKVEAIRTRVIRARAPGSDTNRSDIKARAVLDDLQRFYAADPASAASRAQLSELASGIHDDETLLAEAERLLLQHKDDRARDEIAAAAQRVSLVTAVSPRAIIDLLFVLVQSVRLIRALSAIYGGRASGLGLFRLATRIAGHLAITGGMAAADSVMSEVMGSGLAARLSAKLGEGVLNGILTARIGIAAVEVSRPMPFVANQPILLSEVVKNSVLQNQVAEKPAV